MNAISCVDSDATVLTVERLSLELGYDHGAIRRMLREGRLPGVKIGKRWYVPRKEFEKLLEVSHEEK